METYAELRPRNLNAQAARKAIDRATPRTCRCRYCRELEKELAEVNAIAQAAQARVKQLEEQARGRYNE